MSNRGVVVLAAVATPLLLSYLLLAYALAVVLTLLVVPRVILARKLYWCVYSLLVVSELACKMINLHVSQWHFGLSKGEVFTLCTGAVLSSLTYSKHRGCSKAAVSSLGSRPRTA